MQYTPFPEANQVLHPPAKPDGKPSSEPMEVLVLTYPTTGQVATVSCWKLTWKDVLRVLVTRRVYLGVLGKVVPSALIASSLSEFVGKVDIERHPIRRTFGAREQCPDD